MASSGDAQLSHRPPDRPDRPATLIRCSAWLEEAPGQLPAASLARDAASAQTSRSGSVLHAEAASEEAPPEEVPARADRRWRPVAMAVSLALREVRRQQLEAGGLA